MSQYFSQLARAVKSEDMGTANRVVMVQLGGLIANQKKDYIEALHSSSIFINEDAPDIELIEAFLDNVDSSEMLMNMAVLVNYHNQVTNFDGDSEISDVGVKGTYKVMSYYFENSDEPDSENRFIKKPHQFTSVCGEQKSYGWGDFANTLAKGGLGIYDNIKNKKKGGQNAMNKKKDSEKAIAQSIIAQRQSTINSNAKKKAEMEKKNRTMLFVGGGIVVVTILGLGIYFITKNKS